MGNCLKQVVRSGLLYEEDKAEEAKPLATSNVHDQVVLNGDNYCKKTKQVRFMVQPDNAEDVAAEAIMRPLRMKGVRVKVVLTQSELKQILNHTTVYHHPPPQPPSPPPPPLSVDRISGQVMVKCRRSRKSSVMCKCSCSWNPALHTIPE